MLFRGVNKWRVERRNVVQDSKMDRKICGIPTVQPILKEPRFLFTFEIHIAVYC
jgi:hypothetical protein